MKRVPEEAVMLRESLIRRQGESGRPFFHIDVADKNPCPLVYALYLIGKTRLIFFSKKKPEKSASVPIRDFFRY